MAAATHDPRSPSVSAMHSDIERIKQELLERHESGAEIDIGAWTARFPAHRDELLDYWVWLSGTPRLHEIDMARGPDPDDRVAQEAARQACLAVSLGAQWLDEPVDPDAGADRDLGANLARVRAAPFRFRGSASREFRKAVVYSWIVHLLSPRRERVTRLAAQKVAYLLEQALGLGLFTEHERKALGPYDHKAKYRDAEPIATRSGWIRVRGATLEPRESDPKLERYLKRYVRSESLAERFVTRLARLSDEQLETWATVAWAARALAAAGEAIAPDRVQAFLERSVEWRAKLQRPGFMPERIAAALAGLSRLQVV